MSEPGPPIGRPDHGGHLAVERGRDAGATEDSENADVHDAGDTEGADARDAGDAEAREADEYRRRLYAVLADDGHTFEEKRERVLAIGREYLGVDNGHVERRDVEAGTHEVVASVNGPADVVPEDAVVPESMTFCRRTVERREPLAISNAPNEGWGDHPAHTEFGVACYLGARITVEGDVYGTVCFVARDARSQEFTPAERSFVELLAAMLGREIETRRHERALDERERRLDRRDQVISVLHRVLRHNLRNKLNTVTGFAATLAERLDGTEADLADRVADSGWELAALSDKAGFLDTVVHEDTEPTVRDIGPLVVEGVAAAGGADAAAGAAPPAGVGADDTRVALSVPGGGVDALATSRLRRAVTELVDNALAHAGSDPDVTVTVEGADATVGDEVTIAVSDDGPGLPANERAVFRAGPETKLEHGSGLGLWLVNWIVTDVGGHVTTSVDDGTTVTVHLPASRTAPADRA